MSITYSECVFLALVIPTQCACGISPSLSWPATQYFSTLSHKRRDLRDKVREYKLWVLILSPFV